MRVLLDCRMAGWSGVGRYTVGLARALAAAGDVELVQVCAAGERPPVAPRAGVGVLTASASPLSLRGAFELGRLASRCRPDIVHCPHFPTPLPSRVPAVVTLHDLTPLLVTGVMPSAARRVVYRRANARAVRLARCIVVPSQATGADVRRYFPASRGKVVVAPEAADDFSSGPTGPLSPALESLAANPYVLSMGNTKPHKDLGTLLWAFVRISSARPDLRLLLVGAEPPGYLDAALRSAPAEVSTRVRFTGTVSDDELRGLFSRASVFAFPSRAEGFGLPVLEAMALGAPVVCARAASLPEVAGDAALLFASGDTIALADAVTRVLADADLRERLVSGGRDRAAGFSWKRTAAITVDVYRKALGEPVDGTA